MKNAAMFYPFTGEFGWELMRWQGYVRAHGQDYRERLIFCRKGHEILYSDYKGTVIGLKAETGHPDCWGNDEWYLKDDQLKLFNRYRELNGYDHIIPSEIICKGDIKQEFVRFGQKTGHKFDILIHARSDPRAKERNWPLDKWAFIVQKFYGCKIASVGLKDCAHHIKGTLDRRGISLMELADLMNNSLLLVSPSSGPAHFASLCKCMHIIWTDKKKWCLGNTTGTNRDRYQHYWNPLKTKVKVLDDWGWQPPKEEVYAAINSCVDAV